MEVMELPVKMESTENVRVQFEKLYEATFPLVARFVSKMNGSLQDAKDVFHDALVIYHEKTFDASFVINTSPEAYILGISKHLWLKKFKNNNKTVSLDKTEEAIRIPENYFPSISSMRLLVFLESTGKRCLDLLHAFYYEKLSMQQISRSHGFASEHSASVQKYKCLEKIRKTFREKSIVYEDLVE